MKPFFLAAVLFLAAGYIGCSGKSLDTQLTENLATTPSVQNSAELASRTNDLIDQSQISESQKIKLKKLGESTSQQLHLSYENSLKLRSLLIKEVLSKKYSRDEVHLLQRKIKKNEDKRLALMFDTIDKVNGILGRETHSEEAQRMIDQMTILHDYHR